MASKTVLKISKDTIELHESRNIVKFYYFLWKYVRLHNITLDGYTNIFDLTSYYRVIERINIKSLRIFISKYNTLTYSDPFFLPYVHREGMVFEK